MIATVFGGAFDDKTTKEYNETILIGKLLADKGYVVKCGGYKGIMEAVAKGVSENGGQVIGYTCGTFKNTKGNEYLTETIVAVDIYDRLRFLIEDVDLFIVQRGGIGTLAEMFLVLDEIRKMKNKPRVILIGEFWNDIIKTISTLFNKNEVDLIEIVNNFNDLII